MTCWGCLNKSLAYVLQSILVYCKLIYVSKIIFYFFWVPTYTVEYWSSHIYFLKREQYVNKQGDGQLYVVLLNFMAHSSYYNLWRNTSNMSWKNENFQPKSENFKSLNIQYFWVPIRCGLDWRTAWFRGCGRKGEGKGTGGGIEYGGRAE